jgi:hypothetical protein
MAARAWVALLLLAAFGIVVITTSTGDQRQSAFDNFKPLFLLIVGWIGFFFIVIYLSSYAAIKQQKSVSEMKRYVFSNAGIESKSETASG